MKYKSNKRALHRHAEDDAEWAARGTAGVREVHNNVTISY